MSDGVEGGLAAAVLLWRASAIGMVDSYTTAINAHSDSRDTSLDGNAR